MNIIAVGMQKGGVGKTTFSVNIAGFLAKAGYKTLLIDMDAQASASSFFCKEQLPPEKTLAALFSEESRNEIVRENMDIIFQSELENLEVAPSCIRLSIAETGSFELESTRRLAYWIDGRCKNYDYIIIDSPPSLGRLTMNVLMASSYVILPSLPEPQSVDAVPTFLKIISQVRSAKPDLLTLGIVINGLQSRQRAHGFYEDALMRTKSVIGVIHRSKTFIELSHKKELLVNISNPDKDRAYAEFDSIAREIILKTQKAPMSVGN